MIVVSETSLILLTSSTASTADRAAVRTPEMPVAVGPEGDGRAIGTSSIERGFTSGGSTPGGMMSALAISLL